MGDYSHLTHSVHSLITLFASQKNTLRLLELACGTGTILATFPTSYELYGLDIAKDMIELAKKKVPHAHLQVGNMTNFSYAEKFDVILCIFDSLNHLTTFSQWEKVFRLAAYHLTNDGVFIFDINTPKRLSKITTFKPYIKKIDKNTISFEKLVRKKKNLYELQIAIIEKIDTETPIITEELVKEAVFDKRIVISALQKHFTIKKMLDPFRNRVTKNTGRIFFTCGRIRKA